MHRGSRVEDRSCFLFHDGDLVSHTVRPEPHLARFTNLAYLLPQVRLHLRRQDHRLELWRDVYLLLFVWLYSSIEQLLLNYDNFAIASGLLSFLLHLMQGAHA